MLLQFIKRHTFRTQAILLITIFTFGTTFCKNKANNIVESTIKVNNSSTANFNSDSTNQNIKSLYTQKLKTRFHRFLNGDNPLSYANENSRIYFVITNVMNDDNFTYIKMYVVNNSSSKFSLGDVIIMQVEDPLAGKKSTLMLKSEYIDLIDSRLPMDMSVNAGGRELLGFVIPLYSGIDNGKLIIQLFEQKGSRNGKIEIKAKNITRAKILK